MSEEFTEQPDGRMVAGPPTVASLDLGKPDTGTGLRRLLVIGFTITLGIAMFIAGRSAAPTPDLPWQEVAISRATEGCLPVLLVESVARAEQVDQLNTNLEQKASQLKDGIEDATNIETHILPMPPNSVISKTYPDATHIGILTLERCL
jgi:hypothetical protein